jgi:hydrogenase maturation protein HypF
VVQGVGFRPTVYRLATRLGLSGSVENVAGAVLVELSGPREQLESFARLLPGALSPPARLDPLQPLWLPPLAGPDPWPQAGVHIAAAAPQPLGIGLVAPALAADLAPCSACLADLADPTDRRHGYAFLSCSACGPRYSIATAEPFARAHTTLAAFPLCGECRQEFEDPDDRRFHAETIGCPSCGPRLQLWDASGTEAAAGDDPIGSACALLAAGRILALQGVGGFQLLVDATDPTAVARLRQRKQRPAKPFALLVADPAWIEPHCLIEAAEREALHSPAAPIVLLQRQFGDGEAFAGVAPGSPALGVMLPASALHHLLAQRFGRPLVATSGNRSGEPLCTEPAEALERLAGLADAFLVHDRPIARPLDDSVLQVIDGRPALLRRARGHAPEALALPAVGWGSAPAACTGVLALGGDLKSAPALALGTRLWLAPHLGDVADARVQERLRAGLAELGGRYGDQLEAIACDAHPGYLSHQLAQAQPWPLRPVQHHLAHGLAVMAEHGLEPPLLVVAFDGLGYGGQPEDDDTAIASAGHRLWGGELLLIGPAGATHLGGLLPFPLPGGEKAMAEPRRSALGLLVAAGDCNGVDAFEHPGAHHTMAAFSAAERTLVRQAVDGGCNSPLCSSAGRLFDAAASLLGLCQQLSYEGEGGLRLQGAAAQAPGERGAYPLPLLPWEESTGAGGPPLGWLDWRPLLGALLADIAAGEAPARCAARFHRGLAQAVAEAAVAVAERWGCRQVALAGGCFQNRLLLELSIAALRERNLQPFWAEALPCNDGGLALGQVWAARCLRWPPGSGGETCRKPAIDL